MDNFGHLMKVVIWYAACAVPVPAIYLQDPTNDFPAIPKNKSNAQPTLSNALVHSASTAALNGQQYFSLEGFDSLPPGSGRYCKVPARCEKLNYSRCMGVLLPYSMTTLDLVPDVHTQEQAQEKLQQWSSLRHIPKCWSVIQPFLCALYMPKCENDHVDLPSQEMCKLTIGPCRILEDHWPSFFKCDDLSRFPSMCKNDVRELKFNTTSQCLSPLVQTDNTHAYYDGVEGCGIQCQDPLFTSDEQEQIHNFIGWAATVCLLFNFFTVVTFVIDWRSANKYPALIIFYINLCFLVSCVGWLAQFLTQGARQDIVCKKDGTLRVSEPSAGENLSCVIVFVMVYYFLMAAIVWFVILTYAWHLSFKALGKMQQRIDKKGAYFHLVAWSLPLILTITTMALGEIDGNTVVGICFVGYQNPVMRGAFLLGPITLVLFVGGYFLLRGLITLVHVKISSQEIIPPRASAKIRETIVRMGLFSLFVLIFIIVTFICHTYDFQHQLEWKESFKKYIICKINHSRDHNEMSNCKLNSRPSVAMLQLHLLCLFCAGIVMSSWVWTSATIDTWKRFIRRMFNNKNDEPMRLKKHKIIAQAFAKRKTLNNAGRLSISFHSSHEDPVGINFDGSVPSQDLSSTWAAALPKLMTRRGALIGVATGSNSTSHRRNSIDSEISFSVRRVSVESRRHSLDSQVSVQIAEVTATRKTRTTPMPTVSTTRARHQRQRRRKRDVGRHRSSRAGPVTIRKSSSTSQESQLSAQILSALQLATPKLPSSVPNLKRRPGNAGLDGIKLNFPINFPATAISNSDDNSDAFETVQKLNMLLNGSGSDIDVEAGENLLWGHKVNKIEQIEMQQCEMKQKHGNVIKNKRQAKLNRIEKRDLGPECKSKDVLECFLAKSAVTHHTQIDKESEKKSKGRYGDSNKNRSFKRNEIKAYSSNESELENENGTALSDESSYCQELQQLAASLSGTSAYTQHTLGGGKLQITPDLPFRQSCDVGVQVNACDIALQTSASLDDSDLLELKGSLAHSSSPLHCKGTQVCMLPVSSKRSRGTKSHSPHDKKVLGSKLHKGTNFNRFVQELTDGNRSVYDNGSRSSRRKSSARSVEQPLLKHNHKMYTAYS